MNNMTHNNEHELVCEKCGYCCGSLISYACPECGAVSIPRVKRQDNGSSVLLTIPIAIAAGMSVMAIRFNVYVYTVNPIPENRGILLYYSIASAPILLLIVALVVWLRPVRSAINKKKYVSLIMGWLLMLAHLELISSFWFN